MTDTDKYSIPHADQRQHEETLLNLNPLDHNDPMTLFAEWFAEAKASESADPNACSFVTVGADMLPNVRMVLMKGYSAEGFNIYTNYNSQKAKEIEENPKVALCFHWKSLLKQVKVRGIIEKISAEQSDHYFQSRDRGSQIGAWVSLQSEVTESRDIMLKRLEDIKEHFKDTEIIPRPEHWGGYILKPLHLEFWRNGAHRLHDRVVFSRSDVISPWQDRVILYP